MIVILYVFFVKQIVGIGLIALLNETIVSLDGNAAQLSRSQRVVDLDADCKRLLL
jgi:hypothetical protein